MSSILPDRNRSFENPIKQMDMNTLLILIKQPGSAEKFLRYAMGFGADMKMNLRVMYVEDPVHYPAGSTEMTGAVAARMQEELETRVKLGKQQLESTVSALMPDEPALGSIQVDAVAGSENEIIGEMVNEGSIQMVMIRNLDIHFWFRDSRVKTIARNVKCPVWVIPKQAEYSPFSQVLYTTDYNEEDISTLNRLIELMHAQNPEITALHVTDDVDFELRIKHAGFQKILEEKTHYARIKAKALVSQKSGDAMELVNSYANRIQADLVVVLQENLSFLERLFGHDQATRVLEEANRPVLLFHES